ncbi:hypothetical protein JOC86_001841 [Bacillus pakistanensis]|uniref:Transposase n=1 Tax=Rossellomorea pakistanensis TaxID=992288 RepID=A0ABS2NBR2_9BACI|nr:hypothetical protein [Bacillus pakistanensis]MBM7585299.1 hypothetical protein [Bacillus pakistanensis]
MSSVEERLDRLERLGEDLIRKLARANVELLFLAERVKLLEESSSSNTTHGLKKSPTLKLINH